MRGCPIGEGIHEKSELFRGLLVSKAKSMEHFVLQCTVVDTDRATTNLYSIDDNIIGIGTNITPSTFVIKQVFIFRLWGSEGMMHCIVALGFFIPFQKREVNYPKRCILVWIAQTQLACHLQPQGTKLYSGLHGRST